MIQQPDIDVSLRDIPSFTNCQHLLILSGRTDLMANAGIQNDWIAQSSIFWGGVAQRGRHVDF